VKVDDNLQSVKFYVSKDGKYLIRGELSDMTKDPLAENRAKLQIKDAPSSGNPSGTVTMVEFSDFECPVCRSLHDVLQSLLVNYPQVHLVFKDFPLEQHPWARLAAIGGRCAYNQDPKAFWKIYDLIYDNQEVVSAENAYNKLNDYASQIARCRRGCQPRKRLSPRGLQHANDLHQWAAHHRSRPASHRTKYQV
jgi:protein-disulfide isomerase